jgi:hypothetical protein
MLPSLAGCNCLIPEEVERVVQVLITRNKVLTVFDGEMTDSRMVNFGTSLDSY